MQKFKKFIGKSAILLIAAFLIIGSNLILPKSAMAQDSWTSMSSPSPSARSYPTAVWTGSRMIVWGGGFGALDDPDAVDNPDEITGVPGSGGVYNPATNSWAPTSLTDAPDARYWHTAIWTGSGSESWRNKMIIWGGLDNGPSVIYGTGGIYDPATDSWTPTSTDNAPSARYLHTAIWAGSKMIIWGGNDSGGYTDSGGIYDPATDTWSEISTTDAPSARTNHTSVWTGSKMIVFGGDSGGATATGGIWTPDSQDGCADSGGCWTSISTDNGPGERVDHTAIWDTINSKMIVWGGGPGWEDVADPDVYAYDPVTDTWADMASAPIAGRHSHTAFWTGSKMIVWGGAGVSGFSSYFQTTGIYNTGAVYDPSTDDWSEISTTDVPSGRAYHAAAWTGSKMVVWGGCVSYTTEYNYTNTGGIYDLVSDSWTSSTNLLPSARGYPTAVWTGSKMIAWGGGFGDFDDPDAVDNPDEISGVPGSGGVYNPTTNSWNSTPVTNTPDARYWHTAVWTGSEMIIWGGGDAGPSLLYDTGGIYDLTTNHWDPLSTDDVPSARWNHTAIWTGSGSESWRNKMIVWGGRDGGGYTNTGGIYSLANDTWSDMASAPINERYGHTAIWTGSKMIIWGGLDYDGNIRNDGSIYDPETDSWSEISSSDPLLGKYYHTAVWTGSKMIVWGGLDWYGYSNTGGIYDPETDSWSEISTTDAPGMRSKHTAVWTGSKMIVWGGSDGSSYFNDGGIYNPAIDSWSEISTTDAPNGRAAHAAVWAGSKMIIWGGYTDQSNVTNTGGSYTPSAGAPPSVSLTHQTSPTPQGLLSTFFVNSSVGYAVGTRGTIVKTDNGGSTWDLQTSGTTYHLFKIYCSSETSCITVGGRGTILGTSNGGTNWIARTSNTERNLHGVYFADIDNGWAVGSGGTIINTTDGGLNWSSQTSGVTKLLYDVYFNNTTIGYAVGEKGIILKTIDGETWTTQNSGTANHLFSISFALSGITGLISGSKGTILKTTTGSDWATLTSGTKQNLYGVSVVDADNICVVGGRGTLLRTADGSSFSSQNTGITKKLFSAKFIDSSTGWLMGTGTILKVQ